MKRCEDGMRRHSGVTLIEVMIVLTLIGLAAAALFPVGVAARERRNMQTCAGNLRQIDRALRLYQADWDDQLPPHNPLIYSGMDPHKPTPLHEYGLKPSQLLCPSSAESSFRTSDYAFRLSLDVPMMDDYYGKDGDWDHEHTQRAVIPTSDWVLVACFQHARRGNTWPPDSVTGNCLALRASGRVESIPAKQVVYWGYKNERWYPPNSNGPNETPLYPAFPKEVWPPQLKP